MHIYIQYGQTLLVCTYFSNFLSFLCFLLLSFLCPLFNIHLLSLAGPRADSPYFLFVSVTPSGYPVHVLGGGFIENAISFIMVAGTQAFSSRIHATQVPCQGWLSGQARPSYWGLPTAQFHLPVLHPLDCRISDNSLSGEGDSAISITNRSYSACKRS